MRLESLLQSSEPYAAHMVILKCTISNACRFLTLTKNMHDTCPLFILRHEQLTSGLLFKAGCSLSIILAVHCRWQ